MSRECMQFKHLRNAVFPGPSCTMSLQMHRVSIRRRRIGLVFRTVLKIGFMSLTVSAISATEILQILFFIDPVLPVIILPTTLQALGCEIAPPGLSPRSSVFLALQ